MTIKEFKFIVGQEVKVISKDRNLKDKIVRIVSRHTNTLSEDKNYQPGTPWYKVSGEGISGNLSFFEDQLSSQ